MSWLYYFLLQNCAPSALIFSTSLLKHISPFKRKTKYKQKSVHFKPQSWSKTLFIAKMETENQTKQLYNDNDKIPAESDNWIKR